MNQLEHLRALRDKARLQTEQAKSVLKQQGEITESLDRLIAALEESDGDLSSVPPVDIPPVAAPAPAPALVPDPVSETPAAEEGDGEVKSLGQLISNLETTDENAESDSTADESDGSGGIAAAVVGAGVTAAAAAVGMAGDKAGRSRVRG